VELSFRQAWFLLLQFHFQPATIRRSRSIDVTDAQLDALEVCGYLDPGRRGDRADECDTIEMFLGDSLNRR
jgi:hypothetical protein